MCEKVLVTGASGLVGANLVRCLLKQKRHVAVLVHEDHKALEGLDLEVIQGDVRDQEAIERIVAGVDVVYHLAGAISLEMDSGTQVEATNVLGTLNVVNACLKQGVRRMVHFSSVEAVQQEPLNQAVDECRPLIEAGEPSKRMISPYNLSKAQGERVVREGMAKGLDAVIIRPTAMLGPWDFKPSYLGQAIIQLAQGRIPALVRGGFDWVDVRDVITGAIRAEMTAPAGACYMFSGNWHTIREVAELVANNTGRAAPLFTVPMWLADAFAPLMLKLARFNGSHPIYTRVTLNALRSNPLVDTFKAKNELNYRVRPLSETIRDTLNWFKELGYLAEKQQ